MGCVCSKVIAADENLEGPRTASISSKSLKHLISPSKKEEAAAVIPSAANVVDRANSKPRENGSSLATHLALVDGEKKAAIAVNRSRQASRRHHRRPTVDISNGEGSGRPGVVGGTNEAEPPVDMGVPNGFSGEHAIAGWPSWLTNVAGEAVRGWLPRRADTFEKLEKIGQGTYSSVYKARDLQTCKIVALKKVRFVNMDPESVRFMAREIHILRWLDHPNVIKLEGIITSRLSHSLYLVFEYMEHDLAGLASTPGLKFTEPQVKCFMQQLLQGLDHCHRHGILHRDIKGSNLLIADNGILKIADFGLATFFNPDKKQPLTSRVVTLWYRPPELLLGATEYGVPVDMWSTGCILAELLHGKPIMPGRTEVEQLHKIFKLCGSPSDEYWKKSKVPHVTIFKPQHQYRRRVAEVFKEFPTPALDLVETLLTIEPEARGTATSALHSEFFGTKPYACDPSSLPKYPPSKEFDAKLREEEHRRKKEAALNGPRSLSVKPGVKESIGIDPNVKPQKRRAQANPKSSSQKYDSQDDSGSGFPIDPPGLPASMPTADFGSSWYKKGNSSDQHAVLGRTYNSQQLCSGPQLQSQSSRQHQSRAACTPESSRSIWNLRYNRLDIAEPSEKHELDRPGSSHKKDLEVKDPTVGFGGKIKRIHYSGPVITTGGNVEDILKEHEKQIQQAVRKARLDRTKSKKSFREGSLVQML